MVNFFKLHPLELRRENPWKSTFGFEEKKDILDPDFDSSEGQKNKKKLASLAIFEKTRYTRRTTCGVVKNQINRKLILILIVRQDKETEYEKI